MRHRMPRPALAVAVALVCAPLMACGGSGTPPEVVVTVTGTPTPAAPDPSSPSATAAPSPSKKAKPVASDAKGRSFDFGLVKSVKEVGGTEVLVLDRWTDPKVDDDDLARKGLTVAPYDRAKRPYDNVNTKVVFDVPVREDTTFLLNHCVASGEPLQTKSVDATGLAGAPEQDGLVLLTIDDDGYATGGETFAGC